MIEVYYSNPVNSILDYAFVISQPALLGSHGNFRPA